MRALSFALSLMLATAFVARADVLPTPTAACSNPFAEARVMKPAVPDYPDSARRRGLGPMIVLVEVTVGPDGALLNAVIYKSSNDVYIDMAALRAARESTYSPKLINCVATQGDYLFRVAFNPGGPARLPTLTLSSDWKSASDRSWTAGPATIAVDVIANLGSVADLRQSTESRMKARGITPVLDDMIRVCGGSRDAWRLETIDGAGADAAVSVYIVTENAGQRYGVSYDAPGTSVPDETMSALMTVCPPR